MAARIRLRDLYSDLEKRLAELDRDKSRVTGSRAIVERALQDGKAYYGINTGFGALAGERIDDDHLRQLQRNLVLSHSVGVGELIPGEICRLMLLLKIHALGLGYSGISLETFERLILLAKLDLIPAIPRKGSLGGSGDSPLRKSPGPVLPALRPPGTRRRPGLPELCRFRRGD